MNYSVVIRTLGKAGNKYQTLLDSLITQTIKPDRILVYLAEGFPIPRETIGWEEYIYVPKGMVAQRALLYEEVSSEYILFLDDDVFIPDNGVEKLYHEMIDNNGQVISPDVFPNLRRNIKDEIQMTVSGRMSARRNDLYWGYKVMRNSGYSYNKKPSAVMHSQTNAGPCFLCKKSDFLSIHFEDELWLDQMPYALGEDQVMYYKMYKAGLSVLTSYDSGIVHLDAGTSVISEEKERILAFCDCRFKTIFFYRFILPGQSLFSRILSYIAFGYTKMFNLSISLLKGNIAIFRKKRDGYRDGKKFIKND